MQENPKMLISIHDVLYTVCHMKDGEPLEKGVAYIYKDSVYIYAGKIGKVSVLEPGHCYKTDEGDIKYIAPEEKDVEQFSTESIVTIDKTLVDTINDGDIKEIDPEVLMLNESSIFAPKINPEDDIFKRVIKEVLAHKKINIRLHRDKFKNEYDATNMKAAINKSSNMSIKYLVKWCEILDIDLSVHAKFKDAEGNGQEVDVSLR